MISPTSLSLCFALLLCLPLALLFTSPTTTTTTIVVTSAATITTIKSKNYHHRKTINSPAPPPPPPPEDDDSLFRLAAQSNPKPSPTPHKIAFLFLTTTPLPFAPLWQLFFTQHHTNTTNNLFNIYIHADPTTSNYTSPPFSGVFSGRLIPSKPTRRFTPSLISAARRLLAHALLHDPSNSMFALLSPTCVPLHSFIFTYDSLISSNNKSFIEILKNEPGAYVRWAARGDDVMLPEVPFEKFRVGSQFFVLTRGHAIEVVRDQRLWSKFKLPCVPQRRDVCYPEEHYFATLLSMRDPHGCVPATLTHVDWRGRSDGHPKTYEAAEVGPDLVRALRVDRPRYGDDGAGGSVNGTDSTASQRNHAFLFARKFSPDSLQPLMDIANDVIFRD